MKVCWVSSELVVSCCRFAIAKGLWWWFALAEPRGTPTHSAVDPATAREGLGKGGSSPLTMVTSEHGKSRAAAITLFWRISGRPTETSSQHPTSASFTAATKLARARFRHNARPIATAKYGAWPAAAAAATPGAGIRLSPVQGHPDQRRADHGHAQGWRGCLWSSGRLARLRRYVCALPLACGIVVRLTGHCCRRPVRGSRCSVLTAVCVALGVAESLYQTRHLGCCRWEARKCRQLDHQTTAARSYLTLGARRPNPHSRF